MVKNVALGFQPGTYNPQVEAISPTLPEQISQEDQAFKTTKDELIQQISKVDREILKAEQQIVILKKKQAELEEVANKPSVKNEVEEDAQPKHQSLPQVIPLSIWQSFRFLLTSVPKSEFKSYVFLNKIERQPNICLWKGPWPENRKAVL